MSSKLALLLKQKSTGNGNTALRQDARPAKRQKKATGKSNTAAAANGSQQLNKPLIDQTFSDAAAADVEDDEVDATASAEAYSALVGMLSSQQGALGAALKQQQLQQAGVSDASESESDDDDDDDDEDHEGTETPDVDDQPASEGEQRSAAAAEEEEQEEEEAEGDISSEEQADEEGDAVAATAANGSQKQRKRGSKQTVVAAAAATKDDIESAAAAVSSSSSTWDWFMSRELTDSEVSTIRAGRPTWQELPAGQDTLEGMWKRAKWQVAGRSDAPPLHQHLADWGVKERLIARWKDVHKADAERLASHHSASTSHPNSKKQQSTISDFTSPQQQALFSLCDSYADVLYAAKPYPGGPGWSSVEPDAAVDAVLLHVLNHCAKTADVIKRNNDKIKAADEGDVSAVPRDQGFTRPKALILLPMRNMAFQLVRRLVALAQKETRADSVQGKEKFLEQFVGDGDDDDGDAGEAEQQQDGEAPVKKKTKGAVKPAEHRALFRGNLDDHFRLGIRITRGQIKLFADLLQSDIIVASPVGLATKLAEDAAAAAGGDKGKGRGGKGAAAAAAGGAAIKGGECDFLSSVEVCVLERADVMLMQNWQHVITVLESLNQLPKQQHGTDIMRVRLHLLASQGQLYRQTIITSSFPAPQINAAFNQLCCSHAGKFRLVTHPAGVLAQVVPQVRQVFERFSAASAAAAADARFEFFKTSIWPRVSEGGGGGLLMVVPSYFDFVRVRNFFKSEEADFTVLSEYCSFSAVTRARALFFQRRKRVLLYTERAHFYNRYRIRGVQDIVFYGLPDHAHFYSELVNLVQSGPGSSAAAHHATITALFCKFDALALARVVGHSRAAKMLTADTPTFMFC